MTDVTIRYQENGGKLILPARGAAVPAVRADDNVLLLVQFDDDIQRVMHGHPASATVAISTRRVIGIFPDVELHSFSRPDIVTVITPSDGFHRFKREAELAKLKVQAIHVDEVRGGKIWAGVRECLSRHYWPVNTVWERQAAEQSRLLPSATGNRGMSQTEVWAWVNTNLHGDYVCSLEDVRAALSGMARVGRALVEERGETVYYRLHKDS